MPPNTPDQKAPVLMPDPYARPEVPKKDTPAEKFMVMSIHTKLKIDGVERVVEDKEAGLCGFLPVFDTYEQAEKMAPAGHTICKIAPA